MQIAVTAIPDPAVQTDGVDARTRGEMVNCEFGKRWITSPLAFAGHHEIQIERLDETHTFRAHVRIDADECFIQQDEAGSQRICGSIKGGRRSEMRQCKRNCFFASRACAVGSPCEPLPDPILVPLDSQSMPTAVIQSLAKCFLPACALNVRTGRLNLPLEKRTQQLPVCR